MNVYQHLFEFTPDALLVVDAAGQITLANSQAETLFGYPRNELIGQPIEILIPPRFAAHHEAHRQRFMQETHSRPMGKSAELYALNCDGSEFPVDIMLSPMEIEGAHLILCVVRDITARKQVENALKQQAIALQKLHAELKTQANHDSLTGLLNRRAFFELAEQMLKLAHRRQEGVTLMMIDLDHFKRVNDQFGHAEGDNVLIATAHALKATARDNDIVARHGGEEFVVAVLGASQDESIAAAERLRLAIAAIHDQKMPVTASIGVTTRLPSPDKHAPSHVLAELLKQADLALYAAKHNGRNQVCHFANLPLVPKGHP